MKDSAPISLGRHIWWNKFNHCLKLGIDKDLIVKANDLVQHTYIVNDFSDHHLPRLQILTSTSALLETTLTLGFSPIEAQKFQIENIEAYRQNSVW